MLTGYLLEPEDMAALRVILARLYDDRPLTGDQRRDLANAMDATLHHAEEIRSC